MTNTWHFLIRESFLGSFCLRSKVTSSSSSSSRSFSQSFFKRLMRPWKMRFWRPALTRVHLGPKSWSPSEPHVMVTLCELDQCHNTATICYQKFQKKTKSCNCWTMLNIWPYHAIGLNLFPHLNVLCSVSLFLQLLHGSFGVLLTPNMAVALLIACFLSARREPCQPFFFGWTRSAKLGVHEVLIDNIIMVNNNGIMHEILILSEKCVYTQKWLRGSFGVVFRCAKVTPYVQKSHRILRKELWEKQLQVLVTNRIGWGPNKSKSNEWCIIWHTFGTHLAHGDLEQRFFLPL